MRKLYLLYHELRATEARYSYVTDVEMFLKHVDLYVRLREAKDAAMWPEITFDDGHLSNLELAAPVLESRGLRAIFFITVGWTGTKPGYMGWGELRALHQAGHTIGAHGWSHKLLTHCSDRELQVELNEARATLEDKLGTSITSMSLPGGRYDRRVLTACEQAGYVTIYTSIPRAETLPLSTTVGRLNILGDMQPEWIERLFQPQDALLNGLGKQYRRKEAVKKLLGDRLYAKLWAAVNRKEPDADGGDVAK
ncbi:MAG: polysaccharide deacetylase family protein [Acidobacteriota bacterium]|nr:polysaccharide deacetylase family protein [Acidobacteriota bacterium]